MNLKNNKKIITNRKWAPKAPKPGETGPAGSEPVSKKLRRLVF